MAKSLRGGGVLPVFEEFKPISEWKQDDLSHHLIINLPGFTKEQIKVSTQGQNIIRVGGERLVAGNKWNRFIDDFQAPENTEMNTIRAKLQGGNLTITVPKKKSVVTESKTTDLGAPKTTDTTPNKVPPTFDDKTLATPNTSKDDPTTKHSQADDVPQLLKEKQHSSLDKDNDVINKIEKRGSNELPGDEEDETARRMKLKRNDDTAAALCEAKEKKDKESKRKRVIDSDDYGAFTIGRYKKVVKGLTQLSEERQLLVNMGVAVLVIVSVSAYATYKFASRKDKN